MRRLAISVSVILLLILGSCNKYEPVQLIRIDGMNFKGINNNIVDLEIEAEIDNPNNYTVTLTEINIDLITNDRILGTVTNKEDFVLDAEANELKYYRVEVELNDVISGFTNLMRYIKESEDVENKYLVKGYIKGKKGSIPFKVNINTNLKELL